MKWARPSSDAGVFQSWAPGASGGDERREAGDPDDAHAGCVQGLPDEGGVQEDDGEEVRRSLTLLTHPPSAVAGHHFQLWVTRSFIHSTNPLSSTDCAATLCTGDMEMSPAC